MTNCEELPGRLKDICRGYDDEGKPVGDAKKRAAWNRYFQDGEHAEVDRSRNLTREQREAERIEQSRACWLALHRYSIEHSGDWDEAAAKNWFAKWQQTIPKYGCSCRRHWKEITRQLPPEFSSAQSFFQWSVDAHNAVNAKLAKPKFNAGDAGELYGAKWE